MNIRRVNNNRISNTYSICIIALLFILSVPTLYAAEQTGSFDAYLARFEYPEIVKKISPMELRELNKITFNGTEPGYPGRLIDLYLTASGITDETQHTQYRTAFENTAEEARRELAKKENRKLNSYNKAEFLLHYLHRKIFKSTITGSGAGFNIGIKETLDTGAFNCYKSALIYNAFLEYFEYRTSLVLVPEHIYSIVYIEDIPVEVETTNQYGFDPYAAGGNRFMRVFDTPNIIFDKKYYNNKQPIGNISVLSQVFSNRLSMYSGDRTYSGESVPNDAERAAALGIMGTFINPLDDMTASNCLTMLSRIFRTSAYNNLTDIENAADRFLRTAAIFSSCREYRNSMRNFSIIILNTAADIHRREFSRLSGEADFVEIFTRDFYYYEKYLKTDMQIFNDGYNNTTVEFLDAVRKRYPSPDSLTIASAAGIMTRFFSDPRMQNNALSSRYRQYGSELLAAYINNAGAAAYNAGNTDKAIQIFTEGLSAARSSGMYDNRSFSAIEHNLTQIKTQRERNNQQ